MAEINTAASGKMPGVRRSKKLSTRVDLTPMVDLGFLLITFFVFTNTMATPKAVKLFMPKDGPETEIPVSTALTVFPMETGKIFYYHGSFEEAIQTSAYGFSTFSYRDGIGQVIRDKKAAMERKKKDYSKQLFLIIKPTNGSNYSQLIDILDEVAINIVKHYAISDITKSEKEWIIRLNGSL
jgi:hypothetical protein